MYLCNRNTLLAAMVVTQPYFVDAADAQTVSAPTRDELQRDQIPSIAPQRKSRLTIDGDIERAPCPLADPRFANVVVNFSTVSFDNLKSVDPASLDGFGANLQESLCRSQPVAKSEIAQQRRSGGKAIWPQYRFPHSVSKMAGLSILTC